MMTKKTIIQKTKEACGKILTDIHICEEEIYNYYYKITEKQTHLDILNHKYR